MEGGMKNSDLSLEELQIDNQNHQSNYASSDPELQSMETTGSDHHQQHQHHQDEYLLEQMLSSHLPNCSWPDLVSNSSSAIANPNPNKAAFLLQQQQLLNPFSLASGGGDHLMDPRHLLVDHPSQHHEMGAEGAVQAMYNGFPGPLHGNGGTATQQPFENSASPASASTERSGGQARQRVRARRGQATDPHSIAERLRRERIAERMKGLQQLVPNANKTDKASMLDEIIDYVKFLQVQVKVLSMSRLGGKAAAAPLIAALSSEGGSGGGIGPSSNRNQDAGPTNDSSMSMTENQVVKLMEEDMGSAMQYLQGKGLCLMPISLATAISTANGVNANRPIPPLNGNGGGKGPSSPSLGSVLSVKSTNSVNGDGSAKDSSPA